MSKRSILGLCFAVLLAAAAARSGADDSEDKGSTASRIKEAGRAVGHAARDGGKAVGRGASTAGKGIAEGAKIAGKKIAEGARQIGHGVRDAFEGE